MHVLHLAGVAAIDQSGRGGAHRDVIGVAVRHQHDTDGRARKAPVDRREVSVVIRTGIDDRDDGSRLDDPRVRTWTCVRAGIGRYDSMYGRQRARCAGR